jgi:nitrate/TMAO reductase-like tetraheme cytochrome c subunit
MKQIALLALLTFFLSGCDYSNRPVEYDIKQYYHVKRENGVSYYGISTIVYKVTRPYLNEDHTKKKEVYNSYTKGTYEQLDSLMLAEYEEASNESKRFARVDNMVNKTNNEK